MENYIAIVKSTDGKLDKYQDFAVEADATNHVGQYGGFAVPNPGGSTSYWVVDSAAKTVTNDQAQADADIAMSEWMDAIARTDLNTPRWFEDAVTDGSVILKPGRVKDNYDEKVRLRGTKP